MADYTPKFNRKATGKFNPELSFVSLKCGTDAYVLEDEMNELQWIQNEARANLVREMTESGCLDIAGFGEDVPGGFKELGSQVLNGFAVNAFDAVINGYLVHVEEPNKPYVVVKVNNSILDKTYRQDFVYLECWFSEIAETDYNAQGVPVNNYGGINNSTTQFIMADPRVLGETSRRVQMQWRICFNSLSYPTTGQPLFPNGFVDSNGNFNSDIYAQGGNLTKSKLFKFTKSNNDSQLFIAGDGTDAAIADLNSIDGHVYAIPLFVVDRKINNMGYNASTNPDGGIDYNPVVGAGRPDGKFANIIYGDMIHDVRSQSAIGTRQYDQRYSTAGLSDRVTTLEGSVGTVGDTLDSIGGEIDTILSLSSDTKVIATTNNGLLDTLTTNLSTANSNIATIKTNTSGVATTTSAINTTVGTINTTVATINTTTGTINTNVNTANTTLATLSTAVTNANSSLSTLSSTLSTLSTSIGTINTTVNNHTTSLATLATSISTVNTNVGTSLTNIATLDTKVIGLSNAITNINSKIDTVTTAVNDISTQVANNSQLNNKIDSIKTELISYLSTRLESIQEGQTNANNALSHALNQLNSINSTVYALETQLISIGADPVLSQQIAYGIETQSQQILTYGGNIQNDGSILAPGTPIAVPYTNSNQYTTLVTPSSFPEGKIGDLWIEKNTSNVRIKNTGSSGVQCDIITINSDNVKTFIGQSTFNSMTGQKITRTMAPTDFVVVMPLQNTYGDIGEIYLTLLSDGFMVYNSGGVGNKFDWLVIDTTRLSNVSLEEINLAGLTGSAKTGQYGSNFKVLLSTPIGLPASIGSLGDISVSKAVNNITVYNTGTSTSKVKCLIFKEVIQSEQQNYNFLYYDQDLYTPSSAGANIVVPYVSTSDYSAIATLYSAPASGVGEVWTIKKNSNLDIFNSGETKVSLTVMVPKKDGSKIFVDQYIFNGTSGKTVDYNKLATDFVYCMPTSHGAAVGDIYLTTTTGSMSIYDLGNNTIDSFDLIRIDTSKLINSTLVDISALAPNTTQTFTGSYGENYNVFLSTPIINGSTPTAINTAGGIGDIWIERFFDKFIVHYGAGATITSIQALVLKDTTPYSFPINKQTLTSNGNTGVSATVPFLRYNDYVVNTYGSGLLKTGITDEWIEKADTNFILKLAGSANTTGTSITTSALSVDNSRVFRGSDTFNGTTGTRIDRPMKSTDILFIMPIQVPSATLSVGKIYTTVAGDNTGFTVYCSGTSKTAFEWIVVDTTKLRNVELKTVAIKGAAGSVVSGSGWGSNYDLIVGTPDTANIGPLFVSQALNTFTVYNEGATTGNVKCLVIKYS